MISIDIRQAQGAVDAGASSRQLPATVEIMKDISIDIETLSTRFDAAILSIGAVAFNRDTGELGERMYAEVDVDSAMAKGHVSGSTLEWWMQQDGQARQVFISTNKTHLVVALGRLSRFLARHPDAKVWGNGATFDITILEHAYASMGLTVPWKYFNIRDMRTIMEAATALGFDKRSMPFEGTKHNAVDDAAHQARVIARAWSTFSLAAAARDEVLEEAALAATNQNRVGREWVPNSLWDEIIKRVPAAIRKLKSSSSTEAQS